VLVYQAQISTIHSFCSALLRENGHLLDLDPDFRLCDEGEAQVLMARTLEDVLDQCYVSLTADSPFAQLADTLAAGRDDRRLAQIVLDIYGRVQSHEDPAGWLEEQKQLWALDGVTDMAQTPWGRLLLTESRQQAAECRERLLQALDVAQSDELLKTNYVPSLSVTLEALKAFVEAETWDDAAAALPIPFPAIGRKKLRSIPVLPEEAMRADRSAERIKEIRIRCKKRLEKLTEYMEGDSALWLEELSQSRPAVQALMDLVIRFQTAYASEKRRRSLVDFSDLEHFALRLLVDWNGTPTALAESWAARYEEIQVDEYQDTNRVQNAIFFAISNGGRKLFQVGDVKQSIYRFRLADPTIFLDKYDRFAWGEEAEKDQPRKRVLSRNFRSRPKVLEGCNDLFRSLMTQQFGEMDYTDDQALVPGAEFPDGEGYALELNAIDLSFLKEQEGEKDNKDLLEARFTARRIKQMLSAPLMIAEGEGQRPVRPSDVMILLRSPGVVLPYYLQALGEEGIPWNSDGGGDIFSTTEVNVALSILQIVDNPRQDVPLIAALRSPVYGFTEDQLALLRGRKEGDFYSALVQAADCGDQDCRAFLEQLEQLRFGAGDRTCRQLIWHIYETTNLLGIFGAMDGGGERQDNLLALYALAGRLEESGCRSLFQFLLRLERMRAAGSKLNAAGAGTEGDGVSILSIHRSKGLEKPVVLVCGLTRRLNREDLMRPVLFHPVLGVGPKGLDRVRMVEYSTIARQAVARQLEREMMAEELRLLYVAMTRAKEKLILNLALTGGSLTLQKLGEELTLPISPVTLAEQQSVGQWILLHALTRPEAAHLRDKAGVAELLAKNIGPKWDIRWIDGAYLVGQSCGKEAVESEPAPKEEEIGEIAELVARLSWQYPYIASANIPSKLTATQLKGRPQDREAAEESGALLPKTTDSISIEQPDFLMGERGLSSTQRGSAIHLAMQYMPLEGNHSLAAINRELDRLVTEQFLTQEQRDAVPAERLAAFFSSDLGISVSNAESCHREFKFSVLLPASEYVLQAESGEEIMLQGVIDVWFEDESGVTILDFKSDRIHPGGEGLRAEEYRPQLEAYSRALSAILGRPVTRKVLWFFATDRAVDL